MKTTYIILKTVWYERSKGRTAKIIRYPSWTWGMVLRQCVCMCVTACNYWIAARAANLATDGRTARASCKLCPKDLGFLLLLVPPYLPSRASSTFTKWMSKNRVCRSMPQYSRWNGKSVIPQRITSSNSVQILGRDQQSLDVLIAQLQLRGLVPQSSTTVRQHKTDTNQWKSYKVAFARRVIRQTSHSKCCWPLHCHRNEDPTATQQHLKMLKISQDAQVKYI